MKRKKINLLAMIIYLLLFLVLLSCGGSSSSDDIKVSLANEIDQLAEEYDNFPKETEVVDSTLIVNGVSVDGTVSTDAGTTNNENIDVSVTIPSLLSSRADFSGVSLQIWLNGEFITLSHNGLSNIVNTIIKLKLGSNLLCAIFTKDGKSYRSAVIHIYYYIVDPLLIGSWTRTSDRYDPNAKTDGFEITSDAILYELLLESGVWVRGEIMADSMVALDGKISYYNASSPSNQYFGSTYSFTEANSQLKIVEKTETVYGVRMP